MFNLKALTLIVLLSTSLSTLAAGNNANSASEGRNALAPDRELMSGGMPWWFDSTKSKLNVELDRSGVLSPSEQELSSQLDRWFSANRSLGVRMLDGNRVVFTQKRERLDDSQRVFGYSMGKTMTAMAVGKAICAGKISMTTTFGEVFPEQSATYMGQATVRNLLMMQSGTTTGREDYSVFTKEELFQFGEGNFTIRAGLLKPKNLAQGKGLFLADHTGEDFVYKSADPLAVSQMVAERVGMSWASWIQQSVWAPMGIAYPGVYGQDKEGGGQADAGARITLDDWSRFALWVKRSSQEEGCFGDFVRAATSTQVKRTGSPQSRTDGRDMDGYGYFTWTANRSAPDTFWALGWGGQRIGWSTKTNRMIIVFNNVDTDGDGFYRIANQYLSLPSATELGVNQ